MIPDTVSQDELAGLLGISTRQIRRLKAEGVLVAASDGKALDLRQSLHRYLDRLRRPTDDLQAVKLEKLRAEIAILRQRENATREAAFVEAVEALREETRAFAAPLLKALDKARKHMDKAGWDAINTALRSTLPATAAANCKRPPPPRPE